MINKCFFNFYFIFQNNDPYNTYDRNRYDDRNFNDGNRYDDRNLNDGNRYDDRNVNDRNRYFDRNPYTSNDPNPYNNRFPNSNNPNSNNPNSNYPNSNYPNSNNPNYGNPNIENPNYRDPNYDDRNRYTNEDYEQYRLELERKNRIEDANLRRILDDVDKLSSSECFNNVAAQWTFETNVNEATQQASVNIYYKIDILYLNKSLKAKH